MRVWILEMSRFGIATWVIPFHLHRHLVLFLLLFPLSPSLTEHRLTTLAEKQVVLEERSIPFEHARRQG
jgi:hypothetical protein